MTVDVREESLSEMTLGQLQAVADVETAYLREVDPAEVEVSHGWAKLYYDDGTSDHRYRQLFAWDGDQVVGTCEVELNDTGSNDHLVFLMLRTHPDHRRRGIGTAMLRQATTIALAENRTVVATWGLDSPAQDGFWTKVGMEREYSEVEGRLYLDQLDTDLMDRWLQRASSAQAQGYKIASWKGPCPQDYLAAYIGAMKAMDDAPLEGLDMAHDKWDEATVRRREDHFMDGGSVPWCCVVVDAKGAPAALSEITLHSTRPHMIWQQATATLAEHRNRGLGRWVKAHMALQMKADAPQAKIVITENAGTNAAMLKLNEEMGFRSHVTWCAHQGLLQTVRAAVST